MPVGLGCDAATAIMESGADFISPARPDFSSTPTEHMPAEVYLESKTAGSDSAAEASVTPRDPCRVGWRGFAPIQPHTLNRPGRGPGSKPMAAKSGDCPCTSR